ncbi:MAG TPA: site-2 protease family protein [Solirubrobacteraceae bacterium]|jgi:Zn-dependent protease/CBS domain-containing protein
MRPRTNFQLARFFGIRVGVGMSWFVILFLFIFIVTPIFHKQLGGSSTTAYLVAVASVLSFFASIVLHELGHALVARRNGLHVAGIDLWALGGITRISGSAKSPGVAFRIAAAGPLMTLAVIVASLAAGALTSDSNHFFQIAIGEQGFRVTPVLVWLSWLGTINVLVLTFNLMPAFPLDGGQIAHAAIWRLTGDYNRATRITGRMGQIFAVILGAAAVLLLANREESNGLLLAFVAFMIYQGAGAAVAQSGFSKRIAGVTVADIMDTEPVTIPAEMALIDAQEQFFLRYRWGWFAVTDPAGHFLGVVRSERVESEIAGGRPALAVAEILENPPVQIAQEEPLESLLRSEGMARLGAMVAVDGDGVLKGIVTLAQVRQALRPARSS